MPEKYFDEVLMIVSSSNFQILILAFVIAPLFIIMLLPSLAYAVAGSGYEGRGDGSVLGRMALAALRFVLQAAAQGLIGAATLAALRFFFGVSIGV